MNANLVKIKLLTRSISARGNVAKNIKLIGKRGFSPPFAVCGCVCVSLDDVDDDRCTFVVEKYRRLTAALIKFRFS